jgi:hypothetical protein
MKLVSHSLSLRSFALSRLVSRLPSATNTRLSTALPLHLTHTYSTTTTMPPPPKRKFPRPNRANGAPNGSAPGAPTTPRTGPTQQPKRPRVEAAEPQAVGTVDVKQMYSTASGDASAKPFSVLNGKLDKTLLDGLDKMGFQ